MSNREALIELVRRILAAQGSESDVDGWLNELQSLVSHPAITDVIYHGDREYSAEEIVDIALAYPATPLGPSR